MTAGNISADNLVGILTEDPAKRLKDVSEAFGFMPSVIELAQCLHDLIARSLGSNDQRIDVAQTLVNLVEWGEDLNAQDAAHVAVALRVALDDEDWLVRAWAAQGLGVVGDRTDFPPLFALAISQDEYSQVRADAITSLFSINRQQFIENLQQDRLNADNDPYVALIIRAYRALLISPDEALTVAELESLPIYDEIAAEHGILEYLEAILLVLVVYPDAMGVNRVCQETQKWLEINLPRPIFERTEEVVREWQALSI